METKPRIVVNNLTLAYGDTIIQRGLNFTVNRGDVFIIMGGSGCGKSTLLRHLVGLQRPAKGQVLYGNKSFWETPSDEQNALKRSFGVLFQGGALWSSLTLGENVALPLAHYRKLPLERIRELVSLKLSLVGLAGFENYYPAQISGGMRKRAGLARALALDPDLLFLDEPSAGLDPVGARRLDQLLLKLRESFGTTFVVVTHELASLFAIGTNSVFLDAEAQTMIASGDPKRLLAESQDPRVMRFLTRGEEPRTTAREAAHA